MKQKYEPEQLEVLTDLIYKLKETGHQLTEPQKLPDPATLLSQRPDYVEIHADVLDNVKELAYAIYTQASDMTSPALPEQCLELCAASCKAAGCSRPCQEQ